MYYSLLYSRSYNLDQNIFSMTSKSLKFHCIASTCIQMYNTLNLLHEVADCVVLLHNKIYLSKIFCRDTSFTKVCITIYMKNNNAICKNFPEKSIRENAFHYQLIYYCNISKHYSFFSFTRWLFPKRKIIFFF